MEQLTQVPFGKTFNSPLQQVDQTGTFISRALFAVYIVAALSMFIIFVVGAFGMITSAGNPEKAKAGKAAATNALVGFLLIFASYWIIQIVESITGLKIL